MTDSLKFIPSVAFKVIWSDIRKDLARYPSAFVPNFLTFFFYRLDYYFTHVRKSVFYFPLVFFIRLMRKFLFILNHIEISCVYPYSYLEGGFLFNHHSGVISARMGKNAKVFSFVTIGGTDKRHPATNSKYPVIGHNVLIGTGAKVIGPVRIGNNVKIGANATVTKDVPDGATVVGVNQTLV
jgi:serine O-acetyltransferase